MLRQHTELLAELKDDSHVIPRSSSVVVKRVPSVRPGKGKAAMYTGTPGTSATPEPNSNGHGGSTSWQNKGPMSRRFDKETSSKPATVRAINLRPSSFFHLCSCISTTTLDPLTKSGRQWQGRRGGRDGCHVPGSVRELGGDSGKNVTVGVASGGSSRVL